MPRLIDADALFQPDENSDKVLIIGGQRCGGKTVALAMELLKRKVADAPTIDPAPQWIPVTERLPEESGDLYIVTAYNEEIWWNRVVVLTAEFYRGSWTWNENGREWDLTGSVTHWMPLPEPPKADE